MRKRAGGTAAPHQRVAADAASDGGRNKNKNKQALDNKAAQIDSLYHIFCFHFHINQSSAQSAKVYRFTLHHRIRHQQSEIKLKSETVFSRVFFDKRSS